MNRINYFSEHVLCSKTDKIVTDILEKPWNKKKKKEKKQHFRTIFSHAIIYKSQNLNSFKISMFTKELRNFKKRKGVKNLTNNQDKLIFKQIIALP